VRFDVAKELVCTGRIVEAEEALSLGLVTRLADDAVGEARALASEIASKSPHAVRAAKRLMNAAYAPPEGTLALELELQRELIGSPNQIAAVTAAISKGPAEFEDPAPG
jgi:enoyl-CoA hydratase/carnithine racemase